MGFTIHTEVWICLTLILRMVISNIVSVLLGGTNSFSHQSNLVITHIAMSHKVFKQIIFATRLYVFLVFAT